MKIFIQLMLIIWVGVALIIGVAALTAPEAVQGTAVPTSTTQ